MEMRIVPRVQRPPSDYQIACVCERCGGRLRLTNRTLALGGGFPKCADGGRFQPTEKRRRYTPRRPAQETGEQ